MYLVQNFFPKHKESRTISLNAQYMVLFKNQRDASQLTHLAKQIYLGRVNFVQEAFKDATNVLYGYLLVDLKQDSQKICACALPSYPMTRFSTFTFRNYN